MGKRHDTLVFIPAWNEQDNLPDVLAELRREIPGADVLVVDDGSTDRTADVAREHGAEVYMSGALDVEAVLRLDEEGLRVDEVPVEMRERASGESKLITAEVIRRRRK